MNELDNIMLSLWLEIGEFSATHTCDVNFLGITATITAEIPRAVVPLRVEEKYTDKKTLCRCPHLHQWKNQAAMGSNMQKY